MALRDYKIPYHIVSTEQDSRGLRVKAVHLGHFIEFDYERRLTADGYLWFGKLTLDGVQFWASLGMVGCDTQAILDAEMQHQLYTWALRNGCLQ